jgi:hypothetical protein
MTTATIAPVLAYKGLLHQHQSAMIERLVHEHRIPPEIAQPMIARLWSRLCSRISKEHPEISRDMAERIMNEALGFLALCAADHSGYGPSDTVDIGWHAFLEYTYEYEAFCHELAGRFLHHTPTDIKGVLESAKPDCSGNCSTGCSCCPSGPRLLPQPLAVTTRAMTLLGPVDQELWAG